MLYEIEMMKESVAGEVDLARRNVLDMRVCGRRN